MSRRRAVSILRAAWRSLKIVPTDGVPCSPVTVLDASAGDIASVEPPGVGIAVLGGDHITVRNNVVLANAYAGIALFSGADLLAFAPPGTPGYSPGVDPTPQNTLIQGNIALGNGFVTTGIPSGFPPAGDLIWTGSGTNNRWRHNLFGTSSPDPLPY